MEYIYKCLQCFRIIPVKKPMEDSSRVEYCPFCKLPMNRCFTPPIVWGNTVVKDQKQGE